PLPALALPAAVLSQRLVELHPRAQGPGLRLPRGRRAREAVRDPVLQRRNASRRTDPAAVRGPRAGRLSGAAPAQQPQPAETGLDSRRPPRIAVRLPSYQTASHDSWP